jgi:hypothetical protein
MALAGHWLGRHAPLLTERCCCVLAGVEVWLVAQSAVGIGAGTPAAAEMVCKGMRPQDLSMTVRLAAMPVIACLIEFVPPAYSDEAHHTFHSSLCFAATSPMWDAFAPQLCACQLC